MNETYDDGFFDTSELKEIDRELEEILAQPDLIDNLEEESDKKTSRKMNWANEVKQFWPVYLTLAVSGFFTIMLGVYMGLAPYLKILPDGKQVIEFNTDFGHVLTAILYVIAFLAVTEGPAVIGKLLFHRREEANLVQFSTSLTLMVLGFLGVMITGWAGAEIVASTLGWLSEFKEIDPARQKWVVRIIPVALGILGALYAAYFLSSRKAKARRLAQQRKESMQLANETRMNLIEIQADSQMNAAEILAFRKAVMSGRLSRAEYLAARRAGKTLRQLEHEVGRDLDDDTHIGAPPTRRPTEHRPALTDNPRSARVPDDYGPEWKNSTDITPTLDAYAWSCLSCEGSNAPYTRKCQWCGQPRTNGSPVTAFADMPPANSRRQAPRGLYEETPYHSSMESRERKNGRNF